MYVDKRYDHTEAYEATLDPAKKLASIHNTFLTQLAFVQTPQYLTCLACSLFHLAVYLLQLVFRADFGCDAKSAAKILAEVSKACPHLVSAFMGV